MCIFSKLPTWFSCISNFKRSILIHLSIDTRCHTPCTLLTLPYTTLSLSTVRHFFSSVTLFGPCTIHFFPWVLGMFLYYPFQNILSILFFNLRSIVNTKILSIINISYSYVAKQLVKVELIFNGEIVGQNDKISDLHTILLLLLYSLTSLSLPPTLPLLSSSSSFSLSQLLLSILASLFLTQNTESKYLNWSKTSTFSYSLRAKTTPREQSLPELFTVASQNQARCPPHNESLQKIARPATISFRVNTFSSCCRRSLYLIPPCPVQ